MAKTTLASRLQNAWAQATSEAQIGRLPASALLGVLLFALAVWAAEHRGLPWRLWTGDACEYAEMGRRLAAGEGFTTGVIYPAELAFGASVDHPAVMRPPVWPLALAGVFAVTGPHAWAAHALTGAFFLGGVALATALGAALAGPVAGVLAGVALATTPAFTGLALDAVSETPFAFFVTLAFLLHVRRGHAFAIGLSCGLAYLTRYNGLLLLPVLLALSWIERRGARPLFWCAAGFGLVAIPWWLRNLWVAGNPFYSLLNLNLYFAPSVSDLHESLYYVLEPDPDSATAMRPFAKVKLQLPMLIASWPLASANLVACLGVLAACVRGHRASLGFAALALGTTLAVAFGLPKGRYFVPLIPLLLALGIAGWIRHGGRLALPGLALLLLAPALPSFPRESVDLSFLRAFFAAEREALRSDPSRHRDEAEAFEALRGCLEGRPLFLAQAAARLVWETGAVAVYAPNHPEDFRRIVDEFPIEYAQMERWRKIDRNTFEKRFEARSDCGRGIYARKRSPARTERRESSAPSGEPAAERPGEASAKRAQ